jgi:hypothetical protein
MGLAFLKTFRKDLDKLTDVVTSFDPPSFWYSMGNYAVNKTVSGSFLNGIPQGRVTCFAGHSGCLPADETVLAYVFKSKTSAYPEIKKE